MLKHLLQTILATTLIFSSTMSWGYNEELAASYQNLFQPVTGAKAGKELHLIKPEAFMDNLKNGKRVVALDVRTPAESGVFTMSLPGSLRIPMNELFKAENLARLPTDMQIVVFCKSGTRASAVGTALRHIGFNNVSIMKGGIQALNVYLDPKTAYSPPKSKKN